MKNLHTKSKEVIAKTSFLTSDDPNETVKDICKFLNSEPHSTYQYSSLGIAAFGPLCLDKSSEKYGYVTTTPKKGWDNFPLLKGFLNGIKNKTPDMKVAFDTDVNIVAAFEFMHGDHNVKESLVYITVGTGIGLGLIVNGQMVHGLVHPEGGHVSVPLLK
jgi:fructokinase